MNKNLNDKIKESIELKIISENLCFLCLARLHNKITNSPNCEYHYEEQRKIIASVAIDNGIEKSAISQKIVSIAEEDYPTYKSISDIVEIIKSGYYTFMPDFIPEKGMIHYKSDEQIKKDKARQPVPKKKDTDEQEFTMLCDWLNSKECGLFYAKLSNSELKKLRKLKTKEYSYEVILKCFQWNLREINKSLSNTTFQSYDNRFSYIIAIVENKLAKTIHKIQQDKNAEERLLTMDFSHLTNERAEYTRATKDLNPILAKEFEELW